MTTWALSCEDKSKHSKWLQNKKRHPRLATLHHLCHLPWLPNSRHVGTTASLPTSNVWWKAGKFSVSSIHRCAVFSPRPSDSPAWQAAKNCLSNEFFRSRDSIGAEIMVQAEETSPDVALDHSQPPETRGKESLFVGKDEDFLVAKPFQMTDWGFQHHLFRHHNMSTWVYYDQTYGKSLADLRRANRQTLLCNITLYTFPTFFPHHSGPHHCSLNDFPPERWPEHAHLSH